MKGYRLPADRGAQILPWVEQLDALYAAADPPSQRHLADALHVSKASLSRYLSGDRLPDRPIVDKLVELVRQRGGIVDETAVFSAFETAWAARKTLDDRRRRSLTPAQTRVDTRVVPNDRKAILVKAGVAALIAVVAGLGGWAIWGALRPAKPTEVPPSSAKCVATSCVGKSHNEQDCDEDALSLADASDTATRMVTVMYSRSCQAAWAKAKGAPPDSIVNITADDRAEQAIKIGASRSDAGPKPTRMLPAPVGAGLKACIATPKRQLCTSTVTVRDE